MLNRSSLGRNSMMTDRSGHRMPVPASRRLTCDLLWFNRSVPLCGHDRVIQLGELAQARSNLSCRISWPALFIRAFGLVAHQHPELRQTWYRWPIAHLYQHPVNVASVSVHREWNGTPWLFWGQIHEPELLSLTTIQMQLDRFRDGPVASVFRLQRQLVQLPTLLRRLIWWWNLNISTTGRAKRFGTFLVSTLAGRGAEIQIPPSIHTGCLTYGPLNKDGECRVTLAYDHRVMDGVCVAEVLESLETVLTKRMLVELCDSPAAYLADDHAA